MINLEFVRGLIDAVDRSGIDSLEISRAGTRIRIAKTPPAANNSTGAQNHVAQPSEQPTSAPEPAPTGGAASATVTEVARESSAEAAASDSLAEIRSPMVGTFYRSSSPESPAFVEVGTRVSKGQTLCILEAMKLMNELESEVAGVIREILVENAEPVEYGQTLFRIEPLP